MLQGANSPKLTIPSAERCILEAIPMSEPTCKTCGELGRSHYAMQKGGRENEATYLPTAFWSLKGVRDLPRKTAASANSCNARTATALSLRKGLRISGERQRGRGMADEALDSGRGKAAGAIGTRLGTQDRVHLKATEDCSTRSTLNCLTQCQRRPTLSSMARRTPDRGERNLCQLR